MWKILLLLFITSCVDVPELQKPRGESLFFVRKVDITCADTIDICADGTAKGMEAVVMYTEVDCQDLVDSSPVVAIGSSKILCNDFSCFSKINEFFEEQSPLESLPAGSYSLVSFIDVNANSFPDSDEPFLCAHDVQISALKNNAKIEVMMVKLKSESIVN